MALRYKGRRILPEYSEEEAPRFFKRLNQLLEKEYWYVGPDLEMLPDYPFDNTKNETIAFLRVTNKKVDLSGPDTDFVNTLAAAPLIIFREEAGFNNAGGEQYITYLEGIY